MALVKFCGTQYKPKVVRMLNIFDKEGICQGRERNEPNRDKKRK